MDTLLKWLGGLVNLLGVPGFVKDTIYRSHQHAASVVVRTGRRFTVICVNGIDIYFNRLSGRIDGVGASTSKDCTQGAVPE
jgi:hypothetical protein